MAHYYFILQQNSIFWIIDYRLVYSWLGFSLQQTAANPLAIVMGDPSTGSQRLSMAGGINNFGTTIGPVIVSLAIFGSVAVGGSA